MGVPPSEVLSGSMTFQSGGRFLGGRPSRFLRGNCWTTGGDDGSEGAFSSSDSSAGVSASSSCAGVSARDSGASGMSSSVSCCGVALRAGVLRRAAARDGLPRAIMVSKWLVRWRVN
jgi:hypothetical protein